ncbi:MAG: metallophosphoesterase [Gammaproteobacteria bacterium]|nr:metallophosphoesterase [Gammaproteobacteria bacterium]
MTGPAATVPGVPTSLVATPGDGSATLVFAAPASNGGSVITGYAANCTAGTAARGANGAASPIVVTGLVNGTAYTCTLAAINSVGTGATASVAVTPVAPVAGGSFRGTVLLGSPTTNSIRINVLAPDQSGTAWVSYGTSSGVYEKQSVTSAVVAAKPAELALDGLAANTKYYYRLNFQGAGEARASVTEEHAFETARPAGATFTFTVQADSHLDENSDLDLYRRTLSNVLADAPDFHVDLGDTFMTEKHSEPLTATLRTAPDAATVNARYAYERGNFGLISHSVPVFLVNGNHDSEVGWLNDGTAQNIAIWATTARQQYFANPVPGTFYGGDSVEEPYVGRRASWYSWRWGDALFVVLDPYWSSKKIANGDAWSLTLGERQYRWLADTLASSTARFKFVFVHNLVGGLDGQTRGGIEAAPFFEWGGKSADGTYAFDVKRPGWTLPIHPLLVRNHVTAVFHGHDHLYARQELDGVVYQEVPQPSARNTSSGPTLAAEYHYASGTILSSSGHLRVTVSPTAVEARYVRAWLPASETTQRRNGEIADSWSVAATGN